MKAFIPNSLLSRKGIIRGVDTFFDESYLKNNISSKLTITNIQRIKRKKILNDNEPTLIPTQTVVLTFEGNTLPSHVTINSVIFEVETYIQRVVQ